MEPKLRARRIEVARDQGRRRLRRVAGASVVLVIVLLAFGLTQSPVLDVDQVQVSGAEATSDAQVRDAAGISSGTPMVSVDAGAVGAAVEELPWVEQASVQRRWPGTVRIEVVERVPLAIVGSGATAVIVDGDGRAVAPASDGPDDLPSLAGSPVALGELVAEDERLGVVVLAGLPAPLGAEVESVDVSAAGATLTLVDGIEVQWGDETQASAKAEALEVLLDQADRASIATIDLTVPRAATLTRKNGGS